jgi:hypothetical protein
MDLDQLLEDACLKLGYCLSPDERQRLIQAPPTNIDAFTDAILGAEGLDVAVVQNEQRRQLRNLVAHHLESGS